LDEVGDLQATLLELWPVSDAVTAHWMEQFYQRVKAGDDYSDASRAASLHIQRDHPAPFYWAPFALVN